ncbi:MAG: 4Fe-4S binding protein [Bacteroidales bacterium]|nr:4Fe-4S binding protein [Bacteroidales bacterium]
MFEFRMAGMNAIKQNIEKDLVLNHFILNIPVDDQESLNQIITGKSDKIIIYLNYNTVSKIAGIEKVEKALKAYLAEKKLEAEIIKLGDLGLFEIEPSMQIQLPGKCRLVCKNVNSENLSSIIDSILANFVLEEHILAQVNNSNLEPWEGVPFLHEIPFFKNQIRRVIKNCGIQDPLSINDYIINGGFKAFYKVITGYKYVEVCDIIDKSELRGRGGAGYFTGKKWKYALNSTQEHRYFICNADESDPGSYMERFIMEGDPFKIIEGILIASYAINASKAYIYVRNKYKLAIQRLERALQKAGEYGFTGHNIFNSGFNLNIKIVKGGGAFICGEETALIRSIEGRRGMPVPKPPYPTDSGLFGKPTVINNVETICNLPDIILNGPDWFKSIGLAESKGTKIVGLSGNVINQGVAEIAMGTSIKSIIYDIGGGTKEKSKLKAIHIGGPSGGCLPASEIDIPFDFKPLEERNTMMGSAGIMVLGEDTCMVDLAKYFINFIQYESCGKCIPCREGSRRMYEILDNITKKPEKESGLKTLERFKGVIYLETLAEVLKDTSLCGLGQTAPNPVLSTLRWFRDEYEEHIYERTCTAGVCKELRIFYIDVDKCTGCALCAGKCPTDAIIGTKRSPFFIVSEKCIGCGVCFDVCKFNAVLTE